MSEHPFTDPISRQVCTLHVQGGWVGIEHPGCDQIADPAVSLDSFYCPSCGFNGRVSGAWVVDMADQPHDLPPGHIYTTGDEDQ